MQPDDTMKKKQPNRKTLRFRQWSRKAYAAFASIGRCVTIGCLPKDVADCSLSKQKAGTAAGCKSQGCIDDTNGRKGQETDIGIPLGCSNELETVLKTIGFGGLHLILCPVIDGQQEKKYTHTILIKVEREWRGLCKPEKQGLQGSCHSRFDILI